MANRYWVGGTGTWNTTSTTNWSANSGGSSGASVPTAADSVYFDQAATYTVTMTAALLCLDFTVSAGTVTFATGTSPTLAISGSWSIVAATVWSSTGTITFNSTTTGRTLTTNGVTINCAIVFDGVGGAWSLGSALTTGVTRVTQLLNGSLTLNGFDINTGSFGSNIANTRSIAFGANNIVLNQTTSAATVLSMAIATGFTWTGTGGFTATAAVAKTFVFGTTGGTATNAPNLTLTGSGTLVQTLTTGSWFNKLDYGSTAYTQAASTLNVNSITLSSGGTYTSLTLNIVGAGTLIFNSKSCGALSIGHTGTTTLGSAGGCSTFTTTLTPTLDCAGFSFIGSNTFTWGAAATVILGTNGTFGTTGTLNVTGQTFAPTTGQTYTLASVTATSCTFNLTLGGNLSCSGPFTLTSSTFTYEGTGTFTKTGGYNFTQGTGSTVTFNKSSVHDPLGRYDHSAGDLIIGSGVTLTLGTYRSSTSVARSIAFGTSTAGNIVLASTVDTATVLQISDSTNFTRTGPGGFVTDAALARTITIVNTGVTALNSVNLTLTGSGTSQITISSNGWFNKLDFGTTTFTLSATAVTLNVNGITLSPTGTYTTLVVNAVGTGQIIGNSRTVNTVNINNGAGTATLGSALSCTSFNQVAGNIDFQSFNVSCTNLAWTAGTYTNMGTITSVVFNIQGTFSFTSGTINSSTSVTVTGPFTYGGTASLGSTSNFNHTSSTVTFNKSYTGASTYTLTAGTLTLNSNVTVATFSSSNSNTRNIEFNTFYITINSLSMATATGFTYTGTGGFTSTAAVTRTYTFGSTLGGTASNAPNLSLTGSGTAVQTFTTGSWFNTLDFGSTAFTIAATALNLNGLTLSTGGTFTNLTPTMVGTGTITSNGKTIAALTINTTGTATLAGALAASGAITLTQGTLACSSYAVTSATFASTGTATRSMSGSGTYTITGTGATAFSNASATGITITGLIISMTAATAKTFAGGGGSYPTLNQGGAGALTISGNNSFGDLTATTRPSTITFTASSTQTFTNFTLSGTAGNLVTINSSIAATRAVLSKSSGTVDVGFLSIQDSNATGGAGWYAGTTSTNVSNNLGWVFTAPPGPGTPGMFLMFFN